MSEFFERGRSKVNGGVTEVVLMTPVKKGLIPGERRTYEQRLRTVLNSIQIRAEQRILTEVNQIPTIHFARWVVIRPEHYLSYSNLLSTEKDMSSKNPSDGGAGKNSQSADGKFWDYDEFQETVFPQIVRGPESSDDPKDENYRTWLMTLILFDDDVRVYGREISTFIRKDVDLIFENCEDYPYARNFPEWWDWFRRFQHNTDVFYNAYPGLTVARIRELELFKKKFDAFIAKVRPHGSKGTRPVDALFDEFIKDTQMISSDFPSDGGTFKDPQGKA